jgi:cytochrome c biogenesis factor
MMDKLLDVLLGIVIFVALFGFIVTSLNGFDWAHINAGGTIVNLSFAPYVIVLVIVIGLVYLVYEKFYHKKKGY